MVKGLASGHPPPPRAYSILWFYRTGTRLCIRMPEDYTVA